MGQEFGTVVSLSPNLFLLVTSEVVKEALRNVEDFRKSDSISTFKILVGDGLFTAEGAVYEQQEKVIKSAFGRNHFTNFRKIIDEEIKTQFERTFVRSTNSGEEFDLVSVAVDMTMSIASQAFFGVAGQSHLAKEFRKGLIFTQDWFAQLEAVEFGEPMLSYIEEKLIPFPFFQSFQKGALRKFTKIGELAKAVSTWREYSTANDAKARAVAAGMRDICTEIIALRRREGGFEQKGDVLASLLKLQADSSNNWLNDAAIIDQVATFFVAGHETTADLFTVLFWKHARGETPKEVIEELTAATGLIEEAKLLFQKYPATGEYINDVLLDHPPVPFTVRQTNRDMEVEGYFIPKDSKIILSPYVTRDIDLNFGFGPRKCVGRMFALEETVLGLRHLIHYNLKLKNPEQELKMNQGLTIGYSRDKAPVLAKCF